MKSMKRNRNMLALVAGLLLLLSLPAMSFAQGRGRGQGQAKKVDKFVNRHDARDGRWDGRGPVTGRRTAVSNTILRHRRAVIFNNRDFGRDRRVRDRELRRRDLDNDNFLRSQKLRQRHARLNRRGF